MAPMSMLQKLVVAVVETAAVGERKRFVEQRFAARIPARGSVLAPQSAPCLDENYLRFGFG